MTARPAPRTPVIVGVAQKTVRRGELPGPEPLACWEEVCRAAIADASLPPGTATSLDGVLLAACMSWRYDDPASRLAGRLGAAAGLLGVGEPSGTCGQTLLDQAAEAIGQGRATAVAICGGEALASLRHYRRAGITPPWSHPHPDGPAFAFDLDARQHPGESAIGMTEGIGAVTSFAMRDIARRAHLGIPPDEYRRQLGETMAGLTRVAATNADAWFPEKRDADFLAVPRPDNRIVAYPYTKHMVAMIDVDISAALLVCSEAWADGHGVPRDRRVYPWTSCYVEEPAYVAVRDRLWRSDGMRAASEAVLRSAGIAIGDVAHLDLYSCFASAVNFARDALGISGRSGQDVTVTGGLPYAGGPGASYMLTSLARMTRALREDPGSKGLVGGVGMMMSNHVYALYSTEPPGPDLRQPDRAAIQAAIDAIPRRAIDDSYTGPARIAAYTVAHGRDGLPSHGCAICDLPSGARSHARILDAGLLEEAERIELVGHEVTIGPGETSGIIVADLG